MRIGMFSDTYFPQKNGVATAVKLYKEILEDMGHEVFVFIPKYSKDFERNEKNVFEFPSIKYPLEKDHRIAVFPPHVFFKIKKLELDVIHTHTPFSMGILAYWSAKLFDIPYIGTHHTMYEYYRHYLPLVIRPPLSLTKKLIRDWCLRLDRVIAPTWEIKRVLVEYGVPENHIEVIPTGIDTEKFETPPSRSLREELGIGDKKILLYVGRLGKEKNIDFLLRVFKRLEDPDVVLVIIGDGPEREHLEEIVEELGLEDRVAFTGGMPREEVIDAYKCADVFVFASYTETQGLVILEAMAAGLPVVALGKMGVKDLLERSGGGIMIEELDEKEFAEAIEKVLSDPELRERLSRAGRKFVKENFSIRRTVEKMVKLYEEMLAR